MWKEEKPGVFLAQSTAPLADFEAAIGLTLGISTRENWLPLHLCDAAALTAAWAIWKQCPRAAELAWPMSSAVARISLNKISIRSFVNLSISLLSSRSSFVFLRSNSD